VFRFSFFGLLLILIKVFPILFKFCYVIKSILNLGFSSILSRSFTDFGFGFGFLSANFLSLAHYFFCPLINFYIKLSLFLFCLIVADLLNARLVNFLFYFLP
jgi:hypothetical protein